MDDKPAYKSIVEKKIQDAIDKGKFNDLPGHGKPLELEDDSNIPEELRMSFKILKNAGFVPKEIELNVEIKRMEDMIEDLTDLSQKYKAMKKLELLKKKILQKKGPGKIFNIPDDYQQQIVEKVEKPKTDRNNE